MRLKLRVRGLLLELVLVLAVVGTATAVFASRTMARERGHQETLLRAQLVMIRTAVATFKSRCGAFPPALSDLTANNGVAISADRDGCGARVQRRNYDGPYLVYSRNSLPMDPFTRAADWKYDNRTGHVHSRSTLPGGDGTPRADW